MKEYYIKEVEDQVTTKIEKMIPDLCNYQEFECQELIIVNGQKMTITEFKDMKNNKFLTKKGV